MDSDLKNFCKLNNDKIEEDLQKLSNLPTVLFSKELTALK